MFLFRPPFPTPKNYFVNFKRRKTEVLKTLNWTFEVLAGDIRDCLIFENELISKSFRSKLKTCKKPFNYDLRNLICFLEVGTQLINRLKNSGMQNRDFFWVECMESRNLNHNELIAADAFVIIQKFSRFYFWSEWKFEPSFQFLRGLCVEKWMEWTSPWFFLELVLNW